MKRTLNYIDLFAGAGGLSEGFIRAGFTPIAHVELNKDACDTLKTRSVYHWLKENKKEDLYNHYLKSHKKDKNELWCLAPENIVQSVINKEISKENLNDIFNRIDNQLQGRKVDVIIGGPPCQAYSVAGRARDPNKMMDDPRNYLYKYYIEFLKRYEPDIFVFENVPGIFSANNGVYLNKIFNSIKRAGYDYGLPPKKTLNAKDFGVLQNRKRVIIVGWKKGLNLNYPDFQENEPKYEILQDLFADLPPLKNGEGFLDEPQDYKEKANEYLTKSGIRNGEEFITQHICRPNNVNDLEIYKIAVDEWNKGRRLNYSELPERLIKHKNTKSFTNRFQVVNGKGISHTIVAHIAMDGHYYIHPDKKQNRSISVREAARIQSFPDDYFFEGSRTAVFKQIGNAVPVLMAEGIAQKIKEMLAQ